MAGILEIPGDACAFIIFGIRLLNKWSLQTCRRTDRQEQLEADLLSAKVGLVRDVVTKRLSGKYRRSSSDFALNERLQRLIQNYGGLPSVSKVPASNFRERHLSEVN
jgi:hypothetical protein